jgi:hypothetical protein
MPFLRKSVNTKHINQILAINLVQILNTKIWKESYFCERKKLAENER